MEVPDETAADPIAWFIACRDDLVGFASLLAGRDLADDVVQEAYLVVQRRRGDFEQGAEPGPWIRGILRNIARKAVQRLRRNRGLPSDGMIAAMDAAAHEVDLVDGPPPEASALAMCIGELSPRHRALIEQRYTGGLSMQELAEQQRSTPGAVQVMLSRIRSALEACIRKRLAGGAHG